MYCVSCGSIIGDAFRFCEFCGMPNADYFAKEDIVVEENAPENAEPSAVIPPAPQPEPEADTQQALICEKCGRELDADSLFCDKNAELNWKRASFSATGAEQGNNE